MPTLENLFKFKYFEWFFVFICNLQQLNLLKIKK
jgi:hypothetical protein